MNYPKAIRVARSLADLSQGQLADRAEIDRSYLSLIESGKRQPTIETLEKLAQALKMPFHLLSLLGSEESDVEKANPGQIENLSLALTKLLMHVGPDDNDEEPHNSGTAPQGSSKKPQRAGASPRRPASRAVAFG